MRVGSAQMFHRNTELMAELQSGIDKAQNQISSGRRLTELSEDPAAAARALQLTESITRFTQYQDNITIANNSLRQEEGVLKNVQDVVLRVRELALAATNASQSGESRDAIAKEVRARIDEIKQLANTRNAAGESVFGGYQIRQDAFRDDGTGNISYIGDQGQRFLQIGPERQIATGDPGSKVFIDIPSGNGIYAVNETTGNLGAANVTSQQLSSSVPWQPDTYTIRFTTNGDGDMAYVVEGAVRGTIIPASPDDPLVGDPPDDPTNYDDNAPTYVSGAVIAFNGVELIVENAPQVGDTIVVTPSPKQDIFTTLENFASALETSAPGNGGASPAQLATFQETIENLSHALTNVSDVRTTVGSRMSAVEVQQRNNDESIFVSRTTLSDVQDLDYAEAISRLQLGIFSLQAAQQSFARVQNLSLFNYL